MRHEIGSSAADTVDAVSIVKRDIERRTRGQREAVRSGGHSGSAEDERVSRVRVLDHDTGSGDRIG